MYVKIIDEEPVIFPRAITLYPKEYVRYCARRDFKRMREEH